MKISSIYERINTALVQERLLVKKSTPASNLQRFFVIFKYIGFIPIDFDHNVKPRRPIIVTTLLIILIHTVGSFFCFEKLITYLNSNCGIFFTIRFGSFITEVCFVYYIVLKNFFLDRIKIRKFISMVQLLEKRTGSWIINARSKYLYWKLGGVYLFFLSLNLLKYGNSIKDGTTHLIVYHNIELFVDFYQLAVFTYYLIFTHYVGTKYVYIKCVIKNCINLSELEAERFIKCFKLLKDLIRINNDIFGSIAFGSLIAAVFQILQSIIFTLEFGREEGEDYFINFASPFKYTVSMLYVSK